MTTFHDNFFQITIDTHQYSFIVDISKISLIYSGPQDNSLNIIWANKLCNYQSLNDMNLCL